MTEKEIFDMLKSLADYYLSDLAGRLGNFERCLRCAVIFHAQRITAVPQTHPIKSFEFNNIDEW